MLLHTGFRPLVLGRQTRLDLLPGFAAFRPLLRFLGAHRVAACLCAVAEKMAAM
jgi:hypothetical protein